MRSCTQPSVPSQSRIRRQCSNWAMIWTGMSFLVSTHSIGYWLPGPARRLTRSACKLTKRGGGGCGAAGRAIGVLGDADAVKARVQRIVDQEGAVEAVAEPQ